MSPNLTKAITLLTDSIVAATCAIDAATKGDAAQAERYIKSGYYGFDTALTLARRDMVAKAPGSLTEP